MGNFQERSSSLCLMLSIPNQKEKTSEYQYLKCLDLQQKVYNAVLTSYIYRADGQFT